MLYCLVRPPTADTAPVYVPMEGHPGVPLTGAHVSQDAQCALSADGRIYCWGVNNDFILGYRRIGAVHGEPVRTDLRFSGMALGGHSTLCAIRAEDSVLYCWGHNDMYQTGREPTTQADSVPAPVTGDLRASAVSVANFSTCALDLSGAPYCWGSGVTRLGVDQQSGHVRTPHPVVGAWSFTAISAAEVHQCALTAAGEAYCWGNNGDGQLGVGSRAAPADFGPQRVATDLRFTSIAARGFPNATCGITTGADLYCWGLFAPEAVRTRLGDRRAIPQHVMPGVKFRALSWVWERTCGVTVPGDILCW
jgi:alpha-tubulin suppressor-like RCC1 family protein